MLQPLRDLALVPMRVAAYGADQWRRSRRVTVYPELPSAPLGPALLAQVALDEVVLAIMKRPSRFPSEAEIQRVARELRASVDGQESAGVLEDPLAYHRTPPPLEAVDVDDVTFRGHRVERLSWESAYEPWPWEPGRDRWLALERNRTAHAFVLRHDGGARPWIVCLHGLGTGFLSSEVLAFRALQLHQAGANVVLPVLPLHGPRATSRFSSLDFLSYDLATVLLGVSQALWDTRRVLSWIRGQDPAAVGVHGVSLGGLIASLLAAFDEDLDAVIAGIPLVEVPRLFAAHTPSRFRRQAVHEELLGEVAHVAHLVNSPLVAPPRVPRERLFVYAGLADRMTPARHAHRLWLHWGRPQVLWFPGDHVGFIWSRAVREFVDSSLTRTVLASSR